MTVRYLVATDFLMEHLVGGGTALSRHQMSDLAVSAVTLEWILADVELDETVTSMERSRWRTNLANFRKTLIQAGGSVPSVSERALEGWGKALLLDLKHDFGEGPEEMPSEERLVIATASELGLIYLTPPREWNETLRNDFGLAIEEI